MLRILTCGPRMQSSPVLPGPKLSPVLRSSTLSWQLGTSRPQLPCTACWVVIVPTAASSVMPHASLEMVLVVSKDP